MNILLWGLQILLAVHTGIGAVWKLFNPVQVVPSLSAIPHGIWLGMSVIELFCCIGLVLPAFHRRSGFLVPLAAGFIAAEMLVFCGLHIASGDSSYGPPVYWLAVAAICACIAYGRLAIRPLRATH